MRDELSRRSMLRMSGGAVATAGAASLAGCTGGILGFGNSGPDLEGWLVDPDVENAPDDYRRSFTYVVPEAVFDHEERIGHVLLQGFGGTVRDVTGIPATETDWILAQSSTAELEVLAGSFDVDAVEDALDAWADDRDADYSESGDHQEFTVYEVRQSNALAIRDDFAVWAAVSGMEGDAVAAVESALDARFDDGDRWVDDGDAEELLAELPDASFVSGEIREDPVEVDDSDGFGSVSHGEWEDGRIAGATAYSLDGKKSGFTQAVVFENDSDVDLDEIETHVDANRDVGEQYATLSDYSVDGDGRVAVVDGKRRTSSL